MGKYSHWNRDEIISDIEKFGTDHEREIIAQVAADPDWSLCPHCNEAYSGTERAETVAAEAEEERDELVSSVKGAWEKVSKAIELLGEVREDLE